MSKFRMKGIEKMKNKDKIRKIANHYGLESQVRQTMEECGELIVALSKYLRFFDGSRDSAFTDLSYLTVLGNVSAEIADVRIMIKQMEFLLSNKASVKNFIVKKLDRQLERIKDEDNDS